MSARTRADVEAANAKAVNDFLLDDMLKPAAAGAFALPILRDPDPVRRVSVDFLVAF